MIYFWFTFPVFQYFRELDRSVSKNSLNIKRSRETKLFKARVNLYARLLIECIDSVGGGGRRGGAAGGAVTLAVTPGSTRENYAEPCQPDWEPKLSFIDLNFELNTHWILHEDFHDGDYEIEYASR